MKVRVEYATQLRDAAGCSGETLELGGGDSLGGLLARIVEVHGAPMSALLVDSGGDLQRWILVDRDGVMLRSSDEPLRDGDVIRLASSISGG